MNVLLIGSGGREHALAWKIAQSPLLDKLYIAPGNPGTAECGINVDIAGTNFPALAQLVRKENIGLVVIGPEDPLVSGIHDFFRDQDDLSWVGVIGPEKAGAMLEGSKDFAKRFMERYGIPTARYRTFSSVPDVETHYYASLPNNASLNSRETHNYASLHNVNNNTNDPVNEASAFIRSSSPPYVLKADGLAAGKGVVILDDPDEAISEIREMFAGKFGKAGTRVVVEEFLSGVELSVFILTDGKSYVLLPEAKDYKRIGEGDTGLNTGGMGAVSPVPFADQEFMEKVRTRIIEPTIKGLQTEQIRYQGFIFFGLINVKGEPFVIEYNVRMGDPESEVVIPRIKSDLLELLIAVKEGRLDQKEIEIIPEAAATVMLVSGGYPGSYEKGLPVSGLDLVEGVNVFHSGTVRKGDQILTSGGRVLAVTSTHHDWRKALANSYKTAGMICFNGMYYRKDIGFDL